MYDSLGGGIVPISCKPHAGITTTRISTMHILINVASGLSDVSGVADSQITAISYSCVHVMTILRGGPTIVVRLMQVRDEDARSVILLLRRRMLLHMGNSFP